MAIEMDMEMEDQGKTPAGMVRTETGRLITKSADNAWRTKQAAAMTEQRRRMLLRGMKANKPMDTMPKK